MFKKALHKLFAKLSIFAMAIMILAPMAGIVQADNTGTLRVGINDVTVGGFSVFRTDDIVNPVLTSADCMPFFDTDGYYCTQYNQPIGSYVVFFNDTPVGYTFSVTEGGVEQEYDPADNSVVVQLETDGIDMLGSYEAIPVEEDTGTLRVGVNNITFGGFSVFRTDDLVNPVLTSADCMPSFDTDGYYCTQDDQPIGSYVVFFNDTPAGYTFSVTEGGVEQEYDPADNSVVIQLETDGIDMLGSYEAIPVIEETGTLRVGINNITFGGFSVFRTDDLVNPVLTSADCMPFFDTDGYYCTQYDQPIGSYVVFFNDTPAGYTFSVTEGGVEQEYDPADNSVVIQLETDGIDMLGIYTETSEDESYIQVTVSGPVALTSAEVSIDQLPSTNIVDHESINNGTSETFTVTPTEDYVVTCHDVTGFTTDTPTIAVNDIAAGATVPVTCEYSPLGTDESQIQVTVSGPVAMTSAEVSINQLPSTNIVDHESINNGASSTHTVTAGEDYVVTCHAPAGYTATTPTISINDIAAGATVPVTCAYTITSGTEKAHFTVEAVNDLNAVLNAPFTHGGVSGTTPETFDVNLTDLASYTVVFSNVAGFVTPATVTITDRAIAAIPAGVTITLNGVPYVAGTIIGNNDNLVIHGAYELRMLLNKEITAETVTSDNNKRVDYRITVTRNARDAASGDLTMVLRDSISTAGGTLTGSNGGTMSAVFQGTSYGTCSNGCGDVVLGPVNVTITNPGNSVILTYQTLSNNSTIPASQSSVFTNVATGTYTDGTATVVRTNDAQSNVSAAPTSGPTGGGGGGGGGTGGGHVMIKGDMVLKIQKLISLDNINFIDATDPAKAMSMPESKASKVYVKVKVTNEGKVSATDIRFKQAFDALKSAMTAQKMENLAGANLNSKGEIEIDKINVGSSMTFSYSLLVNQPGKNVDVAKDALTLVDFGSALMDGQDFLTYLGIGDEYPSYLGGGVVPSSQSEDARLKVTVTSDKSEANIGDIVNFIITVENLTGADVTGLDIAHNYDETALEILNTFGGRDDGKEVRYTRAILRPGEKATFQIQAKVSGTAPVGETVKGLTRTLVNEFDGVAPVENLLYIIGGIAPTTPDVKLAQTGPALAFILLAFAILAYFGYGKARQLRYLAIKRIALRPL